MDFPKTCTSMIQFTTQDIEGLNTQDPERVVDGINAIR